MAKTTRPGKGKRAPKKSRPKPAPGGTDSRLRKFVSGQKATRGDQTDVELLHVVSFVLADEWYGLRLEDLEEIVPPQRFTLVPYVPEYIEGVINLRGEIVPVVDLKKVLQLPLGEGTKKQRIVVVSQEGVFLGFLVDAISEVLNIPIDQVQAPIATIEKPKGQFIRGEIALDKGLLILLDLPHLVSGLSPHREEGVAGAS